MGRDDDPFTERARARIGTSLEGRWRVERVLGVGGMATVYEAVHKNNGHRVAVKVLHRALAADPELAERFAREGYVANHVGHPGTVRVLDDGVTPDHAPFLVMELLAGETLEDRRQHLGDRLPLDEVLVIAGHLLDVIAAAHAAGVVHRDLKPENLFLTTAGALKVLDFGVARLGEHKQSGARTQSGSILGTPAFMAPEQARGRWDDVGERTDVWAIGATLFTLLSGRYVHEAETVNEQLVLAATSKAESVRSVAPDVPEPVATIVDRALAFDPAERWPTANAMRDAILPHVGDKLPESFGRAPASSAISVAETLTAMPVRPRGMSTARPATRTAVSPAMPRSGVALVGTAALVLLGAALVVFSRSGPEDGPAVGARGAASIEMLPAAVTTMPATPARIADQAFARPSMVPSASAAVPSSTGLAPATPASAASRPPAPRHVVRATRKALADEGDSLLDRRR